MFNHHHHQSGCMFNHNHHQSLVIIMWGNARWFLFFYSPKAKSSDRFHYFIPIVTATIHGSLPLFLGWPTCIEKLSPAGAIVGLHWTCLGHISKLSFSYFITYWCFFQILPKVLISNFIFLCFNSHPPQQHSHICCTYCKHVFLDWPTFYFIRKKI